ncbi:MAG: iron-containing alcohol dehydrogenase [Clostridiaceae bacterium]|nr:iron-containing alcohol dehydrogenase [Clostridiaceae bacterium]
MVNFEFQNPTKIIFGKDSEQCLGKEIKKYGKKVLFHYGGGSIKKNGVYDKVKKVLDDENIEYIELGGVKPNPRLSLIYEGIKICRENSIDFILAVGGGSVIDSAKGIAVGVPYEGDVWDFYMGVSVPETKLPVGVVLTIPAAGSESSYSSVVTEEKNKLKRPLDHDVLYPQFAIMNPEFTFSLPAYQTSCGISDIMAHLMERYFTNVKGVGITSRLLEGAMKNIIDNAHLVLDDPHNYIARSEIMWTGSIAHNNLLNTGRIGDWASHMIEHELSAINDVAHGAGLAIVFPAWMKYVYKHNIDLFVQFAVRVWNVEQDFENKERTALAGIERLESFYKSIGLPVRLSEIGIGEEHYQEIASKCRVFHEDDTVGNFVKLTRKDIVEILRLAK